ncbi:MAG: membrane protein insertion efficiency factor YidD [Pyrinomonadaceae bacterium]
MKSIFLFLISVYQITISPLLPPACRFSPSCSEYTFEAIGKYGVVKGTWMGVKRICRCQPFCEGGHDPVV